MRNILWIAVGAALLISSCGAKKSNEPFIATSETATVPVAGNATADSNSSMHMIRSAEVRMQVDSLKKVRRVLSTLLIKHKGYLSQEHEERYSGTAETRMEIRIPQQSLSLFIDELCASAKFVERKEMKADDAGLEFTDLRARLKAREQLEERYLQLLQRAGKVSEMIEVEQQLNQVRTDIETLQGRLNYISNKVAMATLTVSMYEVVAVTDAPGRSFLSRAAENFTGSFHLLTEALLFAIALWPLLLVPAITLLIVRLRKKKLPATL